MTQGVTGLEEANHPDDWGSPHTRTLTWFRSDHLRRTATHLTGVEYLEGIASGRFPPSPVASVGSFRLVSVTHGAVVLRAVPDDSWINAIGSIHGGLLATLMDAAMGMSVISTLDSIGHAYSTIELKVSFLKPLPFDGREIELRGHTLRVGRKVAFAEAHAYDPSGVLVGHATSSLAAIE